MQLILDTENPSVNISEKMSAFDEEIANEPPLPKGDFKERVNGQPESNISSAKENAQNKEKTLSVCNKIEIQNEAESVAKPIEESVKTQINKIMNQDTLSNGKGTMHHEFDESKMETQEPDKENNPERVEKEKPSSCEKVVWHHESDEPKMETEEPDKEKKPETVEKEKPNSCEKVVNHHEFDEPKIETEEPDKENYPETVEKEKLSSCEKVAKHHEFDKSKIETEEPDKENNPETVEKVKPSSCEKVVKHNEFDEPKMETEEPDKEKNPETVKKEKLRSCEKVAKHHEFDESKMETEEPDKENNPETVEKEMLNLSEKNAKHHEFDKSKMEAEKPDKENNPETVEKGKPSTWEKNAEHHEFDESKMETEEPDKENNPETVKKQKPSSCEKVENSAPTDKRDKSLSTKMGNEQNKLEILVDKLKENLDLDENCHEENACLGDDENLLTTEENFQSKSDQSKKDKIEKKSEEMQVSDKHIKATLDKDNLQAEDTFNLTLNQTKPNQTKDNPELKDDENFQINVGKQSERNENELSNEEETFQTDIRKHSELDENYLKSDDQEKVKKDVEQESEHQEMALNTQSKESQNVKVSESEKVNPDKADRLNTSKIELSDDMLKPPRNKENNGDNEVVGNDVREIQKSTVSFSEDFTADKISPKDVEKNKPLEYLVKPTIENNEAMEVDEKDSFDIEQGTEDMAETAVTQSISKIVENIVQTLNDDTADDVINRNEPKNLNKVKESLDKIEPEHREEVKSRESTSSYEVNTELTQVQSAMEVDEEPDIVPVNAAEKQIDDVIASKTIEQLDNQLPDQVSKSVIDSDKNITEIPQESIKAPESVNKVCNEVDKPETSKNKEETEFIENPEIVSVKETYPVKSNTVMNETKEISDTDVDCSNVDTKIVCSKEDKLDVILVNLGDVHSSISPEKVVSSDIKTVADTDIQNKSDKILNKQTGVFETENKILLEKPSERLNSSKDENSDIEEIKLIDETLEPKLKNEKPLQKIEAKESITPIIKLSNTMDILSDEEDEPSAVTPNNDIQDRVTEPSDNKCINLDDDDDIMLVDEDINKEDINKEDKKKSLKHDAEKADETIKTVNETDAVDSNEADKKTSEIVADTGKDFTKPEAEEKDEVSPLKDIENTLGATPEKPEKSKSLIPGDFFKSYRKNLADMTRDDLEEFCILKIVESIIDRSNLNDIRSKLKTMAQTIEEYKKKATLLTKQNRDLQVVLKSVQEEQKKSSGDQPITPLKITRSVGMQVLMTDKNRRKVIPATGNAHIVSSNVNQGNNRNARSSLTNSQSPRNTPQKQANNQIPVPRLVPAGSLSAVNKVAASTPISNLSKAVAVQNGVKNVTPVTKPEKRTHSRMQSQSSSVTVDLTDDEPPPKVPAKATPVPPVRLVNPQNLLAAPRQQFNQNVNSPRKVYIPISINGPQPPNVRPGQTLMVKAVSTQGVRPRGPAPPLVRPAPSVQMRRVAGTRHPAPLPDAMKQYQPPNWKALPPAPDLKLSKVENGIVISWKIEGYQEDSYEEIASYQLYAYQETSAAPSTNLWKKIGDVKALPLPMACTLTQFMAGYKYYFAVRAVDIRSRLGPFSLPGSILLLNKM